MYLLTVFFNVFNVFNVLDPVKYLWLNFFCGAANRFLSLSIFPKNLNDIDVCQSYKYNICHMCYLFIALQNNGDIINETWR